MKQVKLSESEVKKIKSESERNEGMNKWTIERRNKQRNYGNKKGKLNTIKWITEVKKGRQARESKVR